MEEFKRNERSDREVEHYNIKLVSRERMLERLLVVNDERDFQERIYPYLLQIAGEELPPVAVAGVINLAIDVATLGDRSQPTSQLIGLFIPHLVKAMVEDADDIARVQNILDGRL